MRFLLLMLPLALSACLYDQDAYDDAYEDLTDHDGDGVPQADDCDDLDEDVYPGADEVPADRVDQDCNGVDTCYVDVDNDGYGKSELKVGDDMDCANRSGESEVGTDCDDSKFGIHPGATEIPDNGIDEDCVDDVND